MVAIQILTFAALAVGYVLRSVRILSIYANTDSALAGPISATETSKAFKIGVTFPSKETLYLTSTATASSNIAEGIECTIATSKAGEKAVGKLSCGPDKKAFTYSEYHTMKPLEPVASDNKNVDWSIGSDNVIMWGALPAGTKSVTFSRQKNGKPTAIFAEVCTTFDHHDKIQAVRDFWERGVAKAYYV
jgi:hypothetical protein